jgi:hypothetical protein
MAVFAHDEDVIEMNDSCRCASAWVQRAAAKSGGMIDKPGHSDRSLS